MTATNHLTGDQVVWSSESEALNVRLTNSALLIVHVDRVVAVPYRPGAE